MLSKPYPSVDPRIFHRSSKTGAVRCVHTYIEWTAYGMCTQDQYQPVITWPCVCVVSMALGNHLDSYHDSRFLSFQLYRQDRYTHSRPVRRRRLMEEIYYNY